MLQSLLEKLKVAVINIRLRMDDKLPVLRKKLVDGAKWLIGAVVSIFLVLAVWTVVMNIGYAAIGARECREAFSTDYPQSSQESVETDNLKTRTLDDHWISALVMQPKNIERDEYTIVCHFKFNTLKFNTIEVVDGNQIDRIKKISDSNFHPKTWNFTVLKKIL